MSEEIMSPWAWGGAHGPEATPTSRVTDGYSILILLAYKVPKFQ